MGAVPAALNFACAVESIECISTVCASGPAAIDIGAKFGDVETGDLFTEVSRSVDKLLWMIEAHVLARN